MEPELCSSPPLDGDALQGPTVLPDVWLAFAGLNGEIVFLAVDGGLHVKFFK